MSTGAVLPQSWEASQQVYFTSVFEAKINNAADDATRQQAINRGKSLSFEVHRDLENKLNDLVDDTDADDPDDMASWKEDFIKNIIPFLQEHAKDGPLAIMTGLSRYDGPRWASRNNSAEFKDLILDLKKNEDGSINKDATAQAVLEQLQAGTDANNTEIYGLNESDADILRKDLDYVNNITYPPGDYLNGDELSYVINSTNIHNKNEG